MRKTLSLLGMLVLVAVAPLSLGEDCSCSAPDGSCTASISCTGGCIAICGSGGNCSSSCSGEGSRPKQENQGLRTAPVPLRATPAAPGEEAPRASLEAIDVGAQEVSTMLSNLAGRQITFVPNLIGERLSITAKNVPVDEIIAAVTRYGAVGHQPGRVEGVDVALDELVSLQAKNVTADALAGMVEALSGGRAVFAPADPDTRISMEVKSVRLGDLLSHLIAFGEITLDGSSLERK
jgi:hypothetical protein